MKNKAITATIPLLLLISCSQIKTVEQNPYKIDLSKAHSVEFYGESSDRIVRMETRKDKEPELLRKLSQLYYLERPKEVPMTISFMPVYDYDFCCKASFDNFERELSFFLRNKTYLGGTTTYQFDARPYFTENSWRNLHRQFDNEYNREIDIKTADYTGDPLPDNEE